MLATLDSPGVEWRWSVGVVLLLLLAGCDADRTPADRQPPAPEPTVLATGHRVTVSPSPSPTESPTQRADPRWRFYVRDRHRYTSPWFAGAHRLMIGYGCTRAPYYSPDPRCPGRQGFHHGMDVAMPCGTPLYSAVRGRVVDPRSAGAPGAAYGPYAFRIRTGDVDVLVGHVLEVYVDPGDVVRPGRLIARANDQGAPDGCHLHLEVRHAAGGLSDAVDPA
ncbi:MAG: M23 family metallopeptidase, partial [Nocardioidaceae bacterium]|nr:M23 family metallopeptidase [Nocardioidaceae bacterium]